MGQRPGTSGSPAPCGADGPGLPRKRLDMGVSPEEKRKELARRAAVEAGDWRVDTPHRDAEERDRLRRAEERLRRDSIAREEASAKRSAAAHRDPARWPAPVFVDERRLTLDLHGYSVSSARRLVEIFVDDARKAGQRDVDIVVGNSQVSAEESVRAGALRTIKGEVWRMLRSGDLTAVASASERGAYFRVRLEPGALSSFAPDRSRYFGPDFPLDRQR